MRYLFLILFVLFAYSIPLIADSKGGRQIANYEIGGFRIGDSLLDKYSESFIKDNIITHDYLDNRFTAIALSIQNKDMIYDSMQIIIKPNDKNYLIYGMSAQKNINFDSCMREMRIIDEELTSLFTNAQRKYHENIKHIADTSGESSETGAVFLLQSGDIVTVQCQDWSEKTIWFDALKHEMYEYEAALWAGGQ